MGTTKAQKAAAERAKKTAAPEVQPQPVVAAEPPKPVAPAPTPAQPTPSKQQATLDKLEAAWIEKKVDLSKMSVTMDGKFMLVIPAEGWPMIQLGPTGGIVLPQIRSYARAWDAAVDGKELFDKQNARDAKKAAAAAPTAPAQPAKAPAAEKQLQTA
jgi:hypothetical protein